MLQQVMSAPGVIEFHEVPVPEIENNQVLVKMMRVGICGSDIHVYHGEHPYTQYPVTQGHEVSGEIAKVGAAVKGFAVGQRVTIEPQVFCGECYPCTHGKYNACDRLKVMGFQTTGAASEYFAVDADKVDLLPEGMSFDEGAMLEPLAVAVHAAKRYPHIEGATVCVLGCGPIGILVAQACKALGATKVMATDISDYRLQLAKQVGVDYIVNTKISDFGEALVDCFGTDKADVIFDCAGTDITMNQAIQNSRKGGNIILVAVFAGQAHIDLAKLNDSELDLNTSFMYRHEDYVDAIRLVAEGKIQLKPLMSKHFTFKNYLEAYQYIEQNREKTMKVLIDIQD
jgi:L-iditol 2-dehydrogenase